MDLKKFLSWIPGWLGFLLLILVGLAMTLWGIIGAETLTPNNRLGFINFGICAVLVGALSWIFGGTSEIKGRTGKVGVLVSISDLPWWSYLVDGLIIVAAIVIFLVARQ